MQFKFKLFNIPFSVGIDFILFVSLLAIERLARPLFFISWLGVVFLSIIIHELGHASAFRIFGRTPWIRLYSFGGETGTTEAVPLKPWQDIVTSIAGPLFGFITGTSLFLVYRFIPHTGTLDVIMGDVVWVNIGWGVLNLLPLYPLDGGRVIKVAISALFPKKGETIFYFFSMGVAICAAAASLYFRQYWLAIISGFLLVQNMRAFQYTRTIGKDAALYPAFKETYALLSENKPIDALEKSRDLYEKAESAEMKNQALNLSAWSLYRLGKRDEALAALDRLTNEKAKDTMLYGTLLFESGRYEDARPLLLDAFSKNQNEATAWVLFRDLAALKDFETLYTTIIRYPGIKLGKDLYTSVAAFFHENGKFAESFAVSALLYEKMKLPDAAYNAACSKCRLGEKKTALKWLSRAAAAGYKDYTGAESDPDFASIKDETGFQEVLDTMMKNCTKA